VTIRTIFPAVAHGRITCPPSKSYTHRALVAGALTNRRHAVLNPLVAEDTEVTASGLAVLGHRVTRTIGRWVIHRYSGSTSRRARRIYCRESGTSLRFLAALAARGGDEVAFYGNGRLPTRPMGGLVRPLRQLGAVVRGRRPGLRRILDVRGPVHAGSVRVEGGTSSQFASALMLIAPSLKGRTSLRLDRNLASGPYLEATLRVLAHHSVQFHRAGPTVVFDGPQDYGARSFAVPGDASSAAFLWGAAAATGGRVQIDGIGSEWPQADLLVLDVLRSAGAEVRRSTRSIEVSGRLVRGFDVDLTGAPDLLPLLGALAATIPSKSRLRGAQQAAFKESDRRVETARLARALGAHVALRQSSLDVTGGKQLDRPTIPRVSDHRVVMAAAIGALAGPGPVTIGDSGAVSKSFPGFWESLRHLGIRSTRVT
jgi:3-phosphoshikimate 1-carboxyvinyltransferase